MVVYTSHWLTGIELSTLWDKIAEQRRGELFYLLWAHTHHHPHRCEGGVGVTDIGHFSDECGVGGVVFAVG